MLELEMLKQRLSRLEAKLEDAQSDAERSDT